MQMKATVRVILRPLVETLPCIGAVNVSLMRVPYVDASLRIGNRLDIMQLPGVKQLVNFAIEKVWLAALLTGEVDVRLEGSCEDLSRDPEHQAKVEC